MTAGILITGAGSLLGQGITRAFRRSKYCNEYKLYTSDYFYASSYLYTADDFILLPDILRNPSLEHEWLSALISFVKINRIEIILPGLDFELPLLGKYKSHIEINTSAKVIISSTKTLEIASDKYETSLWLKENLFPCPKTFLLSDIYENLDQLHFPFLLKPMVGSTSKGLFLPNQINSAKDFFLHNPTQVNKYIVQEYIADISAEYSCGVSLYDGIAYDPICLQRTLRQGNTFFVSYKPQQALDKFILDVANALPGAFGPINIQLRIMDGCPYIFEINPRFSGTTPLRNLFGLNEVERLLMRLDGQSMPILDYREGTAVRVMDELLLPQKVSQYSKQIFQ